MSRILLLFFLAISSVSFSINPLVPQTGKSVPGNKDSLNKSVKNTKIFYDTSSIFTKNWDVNITFVYANNFQDTKNTIHLIDSLHPAYAFPVEKKTTSGFGGRHGGVHKGIDIPLIVGDAVVAAFDGKVRYAKFNSGGFGNLVIIRHANGLETYYAHLSRLKVKPNQVVKAGDIIGLGGSTGKSYSPHLHFEMRYCDVAFDPEKVFDTENYCLRNENLAVAGLTQKTTNKPKSVAPRDPMAKGNGYAIQSGDTLSKIAARNGTTIDQLCALNNLKRNSILQIGQKIRIN